MIHVYVGNLDAHVFEHELEDEFRSYGVITYIWVARKSRGYAFIDFDVRKNAQDVIHDLDGKHNWRANLSHNSRDGADRSGRDCDRGGGGSDLKCY